MMRLRHRLAGFVRDVRGQAATVWILITAVLPMLLIGSAIVWTAVTATQRQHMSVAGDAAAMAATRYAVYTATLRVRHHDHVWIAVSCGKGCVTWVSDYVTQPTWSYVTDGVDTLFSSSSADPTVEGWAADTPCNTVGPGAGSAEPPIPHPYVGETWTWTVCTRWTRSSLAWVYPDPGAACAAAASWLAVNYTAPGMGDRAVAAPVPTVAGCVAPSDADGGVTLTVRRPIPQLRFGPATTPAYESVHETAHPCSHIVVPVSSAFPVTTQRGC
jgi:hypothetical protein